MVMVKKVVLLLAIGFLAGWGLSYFPQRSAGGGAVNAEAIDKEQKWEYRVEDWYSIPDVGGNLESKEKAANLAKHYNKLGAEGWEAVDNVAGGTYLIFKRPKR
jgi:hypothetical protein